MPVGVPPLLQGQKVPRPFGRCSAERLSKEIFSQQVEMKGKQFLP
jgi:hypothetical protein